MRITPLLLCLLPLFAAASCLPDYEAGETPVPAGETAESAVEETPETAEEAKPEPAPEDFEPPMREDIPLTEEIPVLELREPLDVYWHPAWVSLPIEMPPGEIDPEDIGLLDPDGNAPEHAVKVLTRYSDGSVRTARAFVFTELLPGEIKRYDVTDSPPEIVEPWVTATPEEGDRLILANDYVEVLTVGGSRIFDPPLDGSRVPPPILRIRRPNGNWLGAGKFSGMGQVSRVETLTDKSLPHQIRHAIRYHLASGGAFSIHLTLTAHEPVVMVAEEFPDYAGGEFRWDFRPGLDPTHGHGQGRLDVPGLHNVRNGYPLDFTAKWTGNLQAFYAWWAFYGLWWSAYRPDGEYLGVFMTEPPKWKNPKANLVKVHVNADQVESVFPYRNGSRRWGMIAATADEGLSRTKGGATLVQHEMIRLAQNPLDRVKDLALTWPGMDDIEYPRLLCRPGDLPAIREKAKTHPLFKRVLERHPEKPEDPSGLYLITQDEKIARKAIDDLKERLRSWIQITLDGQNYTEGILCINFVRPVRQLALVFDELAGSPSMTPEERNWCLRAFAFLAYCLVDENRWPVSNPGFHRGNINFHSDDYTCRAAVVCLLRGHPMAREWMDYVEREMEKELKVSVFPGGAWIEAPNYQGYTMHYLMVAFRIMQLNGWKDFSKDPRFRAAMDYFFRIQTPYDERCHRHMLPTVGDTSSSYHSQSLQNIFAWAAKLGRDDPGFAGRMMFAWKRSGPVLFASYAHGQGPGAGWTQPLMLVDPDIPEVRPAPLESEELEGYGAVFRNNWGTDRESYFLFKWGPIWQHFDADNGSFHWYAFGKPISLDFGCMYWPSVEQPWLHSSVDFDRCRTWDRGKMTDFASLTDADFAGGPMEVTDVHLVDYDPLQPPPRHKPFPRRSGRHFLDWRRDVLFVRGADYVVMRDTIDNPSEIETTGWTVQALAAKSGIEGRRARFQGQHGVDLDIHVIKPEKSTLTLKEWGHTGKAAPDWMEARPMNSMGETQIALGTRAPADQDYLAVMIPYRIGSEPPAVAVEGSDIVKVTYGGNQDTIFFAEKRRTMDCNAIRLEGRVAMVRRSDRGTSLNLFDGASLSADGILAAFPRAGSVEIGKEGLKGTVHGPAGECVIRWTLSPPPNPRVILDGTTLGAKRTPEGEIRFPVPEGKHTFEIR